MLRHLIAPTLIALCVGAPTTALQAQPKSAPPQCFSARDWGDWRASADARSIYLRVGVSRIYRLDLASACPTLKWPSAHLISKLRGSDQICGPLDLDLQVSDGPGTAVPCIVRGVTALTPEQAAALPKDERP